MKTTIYYTTSISLMLGAVMLFSAGFSGCSSDDDDTIPAAASSSIYPMFVDNNSNAICDYFEEATHDPGSAARQMGVATQSHQFVDMDQDGVCDYAQNGSPTWHGPGFIDEDSDGICDYWDEGTPKYNQNGGMQYQDQNQNQINDHFELQWHEGYDHSFVDNDGDGVCDYAQSGGVQMWHGPGYVDNDSNGMPDDWEMDGKGHGGMDSK